MKLNWNFLGGGRVQNKQPSVGGVWIFYGTAQCRNDVLIHVILGCIVCKIPGVRVGGGGGVLDP